ASWARLELGLFLLRRCPDASWTSWTYSLPTGKREWLQRHCGAVITRSSLPSGPCPRGGHRQRVKAGVAVAPRPVVHLVRGPSGDVGVFLVCANPFPSVAREPRAR